MRDNKQNSPPFDFKNILAYYLFLEADIFPQASLSVRTVCFSELLTSLIPRQMETMVYLFSPVYQSIKLLIFDRHKGGSWVQIQSGTPIFSESALFLEFT